MNLWTKTILLSAFLAGPLAQAEKISFHVSEYVGYKNVYANSDGTLSFIEPTVVFDGVARPLYDDIYHESAKAFCNSVGPFSANSLESKNTKTAITAYNHRYSRIQESGSYISLIRCKKNIPQETEILSTLPPPPSNAKFMSLDRPSKLVYSKYYANYNGITTYIDPRMFFDNHANFLSDSNADLACEALGKEPLNIDYSEKAARIHDPESHSTYQGRYISALRCQDRAANSSARKEDLRAPVSYTKKIENFGGITTYISPKIKFDGAEQLLDSSSESGQVFCAGVGKSYVNGEDQYHSNGIMAYNPEYFKMGRSIEVMTLIRCQ